MGKDILYPFGKYKGWPLEKIPEDYLFYVVRKIKNRKDLVLAATRILEKNKSDYSMYWKSGRVSNMGDVTLTVNFGKYKGKTIEEIPSSYLKWMISTIEDKEDLIAGAETELQYRTDHNEHFED